MANRVVSSFDIPGVKPVHSGKVRESFKKSVFDPQLLICSTDRASAFDVVLPNPIPDKGISLNQISAFWFGDKKIQEIIPNHMITIDDGVCLNYLGISGDEIGVIEALSSRMMLVRNAARIDIECVVRGFLFGSAWGEYKQTGYVYGYKLPKGLKKGDGLLEPIFTPTTKESGHDHPISLGEMKNRFGEELTWMLAGKSLAIYNYAAAFASQRGIIIADTKMEFGEIDGKLILIDELLTPDSSRFWDRKAYEETDEIVSFDKQPLRDWLEDSGWDKQPPAPELPRDVVQATSERYKRIYQLLTGKHWVRD